MALAINTLPVAGHDPATRVLIGGDGEAWTAGSSPAKGIYGRMSAA